MRRHGLAQGCGSSFAVEHRLLFFSSASSSLLWALSGSFQASPSTAVYTPCHAASRHDAPPSAFVLRRCPHLCPRRCASSGQDAACQPHSSACNAPAALGAHTALARPVTGAAASRRPLRVERDRSCRFHNGPSFTAGARPGALVRAHLHLQRLHHPLVAPAVQAGLPPRHCPDLVSRLQEPPSDQRPSEGT